MSDEESGYCEECEEWKAYCFCQSDCGGDWLAADCSAAPPQDFVAVGPPRSAEPVARDEVICEDLQTKENLAATSYENILKHAGRLIYELDLQGDFEDAAIIAALIERSTERHAAASDFLSASKDRWKNEVMGLPHEKPNNGASGRRNDKTIP